jgi:hypothetical protein
MEVQRPCRPAELRLEREKSGRAERPALHLSACDFAQLVALPVWLGDHEARSSRKYLPQARVH